MIVSNVEQGSEAWFDLRRGRPTASRFADVITAAKGELSKSAPRYMAELVAQCFVRNYATWEGNTWTDRGIEMEPEAIAEFESRTGLSVERVGFVTRADMVVGCSPDGLLTVEGVYVGGVEVKCPKLHTHVEWVAAGGLPEAYKQQVHGSLAVTGLPVWHFFSYFPGVQPHHVIVQRDAYTERLSAALDQFLIDYAAYRARVISLLQLDGEETA